MTGAVELLFAVAAGFLVWLAHGAFRPYARCWWCRGNARRSSRSGRTWRLCRVCGGKGSRVRVGSRVAKRVFGGRSET